MTCQVTLVMGVSGVGKTSVALGLCSYLDARYLEADEFHPPANVAAMARGEPLTDEMRAPWLAQVGQATALARENSPVVLACSALKRSYRDALRLAIGPMRFVLLTADRRIIAARMDQRKGHFMPATLLDSQLATLEMPDDEPDIVTVEVSGELDLVIVRTLAVLAAPTP